MLDAYRYTVRFSNPSSHYAEVEAVYPAESDSLELFMAVWTPGSYLVREYSRHLEDLAGEEPVKIRKMRKNRWRVETHGAKEVRVSYKVYCHELSVRTNWVDEQFALLQGAATYLGVAGDLSRPHIVKLILPDSWAESVSGLPCVGTHQYAAPDFDALVDSPILLGNPAQHQFELDGKEHFLVHSVKDAMWDWARSVEDISRITATHLGMWGSLPYSRYWFLNILVEGSGGGGLEHKNSCCLIASRYATRTRSGYVKWLELLSHEFFHVWNVKRLRPLELGPFDYENENYTRGLWVAEGFTQYYGSLMAARAGVITRDEYLNTLTGEIEALQTTPGRFTRSLDISSYDAWIKAYRPDENSGNTTISYYTKGAVIAFLLDARIRAATDGKKTLDDLMVQAHARYSGTHGFPEKAIQELAGELAGTTCLVWLVSAVETTTELDYSAALEYFGLRFKAVPAGQPRAWLGITTKAESGRIMIATVSRGTPAFDAGLSAGDEILGIDDSRVLPEQWTQRMEQMRPAEHATMLLSRSGRLTSVPVTFADDPGRAWTLEVDPKATPAQRERFNAWLGPPRQP